MGTYVHTETDGNVTKVTKYTCEEKGMQYTVISDDIKENFNFLLDTGDICEKLDEMLKDLSFAASIDDAFLFENSEIVKNISKAYDEIKSDVTNLKESLSTLYDVFITNIDNVNDELETNFGHFIGYSVSEGDKATTNSISS